MDRCLGTVRNRGMERPELKYKSSKAQPDSVHQEIVALASHRGGKVMSGVCEKEEEIPAILCRVETHIDK